MIKAVFNLFIPMTKEQIVQMLSDSDIMNYEKLKVQLTIWKLQGLTSDDVLRVMILALSAYDKVIQKILKDLD